MKKLTDTLTEYAPNSKSKKNNQTNPLNSGKKQKQIGYLIPEFPSQTHIWMWREISHMREWGNAISIFSTKPPSADIQARHAFAPSARQETYYLWPQRPWYLFTTLLWVIWTRPVGLYRAIWLGLTLDVEARPRWRSHLPLVLAASILAREAEARGIGHLHCHSCANSAVLAMMLKRLSGIPYSMTLNANLEWWGGAMREKLTDASFTIAITEWLLKQMQRDYPQLQADQAILGRIGVDTIAWKPAIAPNKANKSFQIITVGRLHPSKGHDVLIAAVNMLLNAGHDIKLTIVGAGPQRSNLESLVKNLNLSDIVNFTGSLSEDEIIQHLRQSDLFVLASHMEPLGVVYMEAMAMEVATIGTNAGGVPEIITDRDDGLLVPPRDHVALAEAIELLIQNPQLRLQLARNGRKSIIQRFDSRIGAATLHQRLFGSLPENYQPPLIE